jgi:hypothetical protein
MHKSLMVAIAAAAIVAGRDGQAVAMTLPAPSIGAPAAISFVQPVTNVCGTNGCVRVQTAPPRKRPPPNHRP